MFGYSLTLRKKYGRVLPETKQDKHKKTTEMPDYKQNGGQFLHTIINALKKYSSVDISSPLLVGKFSSELWS